MIAQRIVPIAEPVIGKRELDYVTDALRSGWVSSKGPYVEMFEAAVANGCGAIHAVAVSSGTTGLHLAFAALGIGRGDEVIVPTFSFVAVASTVKHVGATPVFADSDPEHWCIDPDDVERRITPRTRAIMPVHLYGHPVDMDAINRIARRHGLWVVENAAEAMGATYKGRPVGTLGDVGIFSFYGNKLITSGEGGMVVTNDHDLGERLRMLRDHGMDPTRPYWHPVVGYNFRLTNLQAAVGLAQHEQIQTFLRRKQEIAARYCTELGSVLGIAFQPTAAWATHSSWLFAIMVGDAYGLSRDQLQQALRDRGIDTRRAAYQIHTMPPYRSGDRGRYPVAERLSAQGLHLPSGSGLTLSDQTYVIDSIRQLAGAEPWSATTSAANGPGATLEKASR
jgi:perosamine synthetase